MADTLVFFALERITLILTDEIAESILFKPLLDYFYPKDEAMEEAESSSKSIQAESSTKSVSENLTEIGHSLRMMQFFLNYANGRIDEDENIPIIVAEIADIAYQIIHALVSSASQVQASETRGSKNLLTRFPCIPNKGLSYDNKFSSEIEAIKEKTTSFTARLKSHTRMTTTKNIKRLVDSKGYSRKWDRRDVSKYRDQQLLTPYPHLINEDPIGMDTDEVKLVEKLINNNTYTVITINGEEGSGKTAIAKKIYNCIQIRCSFECMAWGQIKVGDLDLKEAFRDILTGLLPRMKDEILRMEYNELGPRIIKVLEEKKCLVVIDHVESGNLCNVIDHFFEQNVGCSKIMITSREFTLGYEHHLEPLNEMESNNLFEKVAPSRSYSDEQLEKLVQVCNGSRLAIAIVGGYPVGKGFYRLLDRKEINLDTVLRHIYLEIPYDLRACLRYLAKLPEIPVEKLFQLWIAENLLPPNKKHYKKPPTLSAIATAKKYLVELAERNLVHLNIDEHTGQFKSCRINDLMREICLEKHSIDNFIKLEKIQNDESTPTSNRKYINRSRLAMSLNELDNYLPYSRRISPDLLSAFIFLRKSEGSKISRTLQACIIELKLVRVLDLGGLIIPKLDQAIGKLIHLKYLGLRNTLFHELPSTIQNMSNLETLDLRDDNTQHSSITVPNILFKLNRLSYLFLRRIAVSGARKEKLRLNGLVNLRILEIFDSEQFEFDDLLKLPKLRILKLGINGMACVSRIIPCIPKYRRFWQLTLSITNCDFYTPEGQILLIDIIGYKELSKLTLDGRIGMFKEFSPENCLNLTQLTLESCELVENSISILEKFPSLRVLSLKWNAFVGEKMVFQAQGFPKLRFLQLLCLNSLKDWEVCHGAMPKLSTIHIISCPNLEKIPDGLQSVSTLKLLLIKWMPKSFTDRLSNTVNGNQHASIQIINHGREYETAKKKQEVNKEVSDSGSRGGDTIDYEDKGKDLMRDFYAEGSSSKLSYEDYDDYAPNEVDHIWQLGYPHTTTFN